ncbi:type II toxin-antitoxin system mRNA interferase toxin, RelE/StbE family [Cupriavidus sp. UYPR2.512]|uniref:type II toxin-antitoxin system RelE/ParE family toxin n=1 Tax=Cupriavidus sp. UYPR2.512 TaxID=1080187 RepID=UPI00036CA18C|nr:type II toxin-antitoxin system mRNA interferase toxin, RelE/StbE family [Cupriavidus sp. UYPR2.512]UIF88753.1 type II toxin-antitoxin system mRNA interferase toxin, RelE/StbE family [Cupriavidus necator]
MSAVEWTAPARADLLAIVDYISDDNPDAAQRLVDELQAKAAHLPEHPLLYRAGRVAGTREMVVAANYLVVYTAGANAIRILRVLHAAQQWPSPSEPNHDT